MHIGGFTIPSPMDVRGSYKYDPAPVLRTNGRGEAVTLPYATLVWSFDFLLFADYDWWYTELLDGETSKKFTSAQLLNNRGVLLTFTNVVVQRPTYDFVKGPEYNNVVVNISRMKL